MTPAQYKEISRDAPPDDDMESMENHDTMAASHVHHAE